MNAASAHPAELRAAPAASRRTVDAATRTFHWLLALCFAGAYLTAEGERWRLVHVTLGYSLAGLLAFRLLWGFAGPRAVRWSAWWGKLRGLPLAWQQLRGRAWPLPAAQNVAMALALAGLVVGLACTAATGWITYEELAGEWMEDVHELLGNLALALVLAHVGLVGLLSVVRRRNLAAPMVTGRTPGRGPDLAPRTGWLAALLLAAVLTFWAMQWQQVPAVSPPGHHQHHDRHRG